MKKYIWILFICSSIFGVYLSINYFKKSIPLINIKINTDKEFILKKAKEISKKYNIGPEKFHSIIYFNSESNIQNYIELELNGSKSVENVIKNKLYYPYTWQVRLFKEFDPNECVIKFTPDGSFYGFTEHISEDVVIPSLTESQAKEVIKNFLKDQSIDLNDYTEISISSEKRANSRIDYNFIYQKNVKEDKLKYRINLTLCGDKITIFNHYIDIPESFNKKFEKINAYRETLSYFAYMFMYTVYLFIGCLFGLIYLIKKNWLIPKKAIIIGLILALLEFICKLNDIPFIWINYNTKNSLYACLIGHITGAFVLSLVTFVVYTVTIAVAEGLTRLIFKDHIQLFKLLKFKVLSSSELIKINLITYLILPLNIAFIFLFYFFGNKFFGWWSPSVFLLNPNILSTCFPALGIIAQSFKISFWEECLYRAIPISFFYLLIKKSKYKKSLLVIGLLFQALIFSVSHAIYLTIPYYVRLIELIVPSIIFGILYIKLGLFSVILLHFLYDTIFLSLTLFVTNNIIYEKLILLLGLFLPAILTLAAFLIKKLFKLKFENNFYNRDFKPKSTEIINKEKDEPTINYIKDNYINVLSFLAITLFLISLFFIKLKPDFGFINISRPEAIKIAKDFLKEKNVEIDNSWSILTSIYYPKENILEDNFAWQKGKDIYNKLNELDYISSKLFRVRFAKFENYGKEEEHDIYIKYNKVFRYKKIIPLDSPGKYLSKDQATEIALDFISNKLNKNKKDLEEIYFKKIERKDRQDWEFAFKDNIDDIKQITKQIIVNVSGSEITDFYKNITVPQNFILKEENNKYLTDILSLITGVISLFFTVIGLLYFLNLFKKANFKLSKLKLYFLIYSLLLLIKRYLIIPETISNFNINKPFLSQFISNEFGSCTYILAQIISTGLIFAVITNYNYKRQILNIKNLKVGLILSFSLAVFISSLYIFLEYFIYYQRPYVFEFIELNSYSPSLLYIINNILNYLDKALYFIFIAQLAQYKFNLRSILIFLLSSLTLFQLDAYSQISSFLLFSFILFLALYLIYILIVKFDLTLIILIYTFIYIIYLLKNYYISIFSTILSIIFIIITALIAIKALRNNNTI